MRFIPGKTQTTKNRELDDTQRSLDGLIKQLEGGPLGLDTISSFTLPFRSDSWAALGTVFGPSPFVTLSESARLSRAVFCFSGATAANPINNRSFTLTRYRNGSARDVLASRNTSVASILAFKPFDLDLNRNAETLLCEKDDVLVLTIDGSGGGARPALRDGSFTLYFEKS